MKVELTIDFNKVPKGTIIEVDSQDEIYYYGLWVSMLGSFKIALIKDYCKII